MRRPGWDHQHIARPDLLFLARDPGDRTALDDVDDLVPFVGVSWSLLKLAGMVNAKSQASHARGKKGEGMIYPREEFFSIRKPPGTDCSPSATQRTTHAGGRFAKNLRCSSLHGNGLSSRPTVRRGIKDRITLHHERLGTLRPPHLLYGSSRARAHYAGRHRHWQRGPCHV